MKNPRAKRSLGQNFLTALWPVRTMAKAATIQPYEAVIEIGPGKGILTKELLYQGAHVIAVEKDDALYANLQQTFSHEIRTGTLTLIHGDILGQDVKAIVDGQQYKVVANIPYNITGLIIPFFLESEHQPTSMTLLVQKEVADRICTKNNKESILSLSVKVFGVPKYVEKVGKSLFRPRPQVDSAIIHIADIATIFKNTQEKSLFFEIIKKSFNGKRKKISSTLKDYNLPPQVKDRRPEDLSVEDWKRLVMETLERGRE